MEGDSFLDARRGHFHDDVAVGRFRVGTEAVSELREFGSSGIVHAFDLGVNLDSQSDT